MAGTSGLGTNYNLPNYTGILHQLTPSDTPFFSALGGLTGGKSTTSTEFEWTTFDLRDAAQNPQVEGAAAPTADNRVRANISNVVQIHQETVGVSYSKAAATGLKAGSNNDLGNNVPSEVDWQTEQMLKQMVNDIEFSFINGVYHKPSDNSTARATRGIRQAAGTKISKGTLVGTFAATAADEKFTLSAHGLDGGERVYIPDPTEAAAIGLDSNVTYYAKKASAAVITLSLTAGGADVNVTTNGSVDLYTTGSDVPSPEIVGELMQSVWDAGGIRESETAVLLVGSTQKLAMTTEFIDAYGKVDLFMGDRTVGGVSLQTVMTDFGTVNVMLSRYMAADEIMVASLEQCAPVYLEVPGKGHFFAEPLSKTGATEQVHLYGEVGLEYGNPNAHGLIRGLAV